ncbi:Cyanovirin-N [Fimicolochytrium jonesii]|uniref:Cyanovirin-N n=1 Tax=Fimicolochytrium jonesii TaxID=1396493 RepID=UPI0022FE7511|nr:Cyanovirin-N [Fimicolochytrium jonesii]KAI8827181.1 Cyanovirin-N [Fimicolochytrium jonesii]
MLYKYLIVLVATFLVAFPSFAHGASGYLGSCRNVRLNSQYRETLDAECKNNGGSYRAASIYLPSCLGNTNGVLVSPGSGYQNSCRDCAYQPGGVFYCQCKNRAGTWKTSRVNTNGFIGNFNGLLRC